MTSLACVTGRFQPVHEQHVELFEIAAERAEHLIVAITNPDSAARHEESTSQHRHLPEANPFTYFERHRMITAALTGQGLADRCTIVPFDMTRPAGWPEYVPLTARQLVRAYDSWERDKAARLADAGYRVTLLEGDPATKIAASDIRAHLATPGGWAGLVPESVAPVLTQILTERRPPQVPDERGGAA